MSVQQNKKPFADDAHAQNDDQGCSQSYSMISNDLRWSAA